MSFKCFVMRTAKVQRPPQQQQQQLVMVMLRVGTLAVQQQQEREGDIMPMAAVVD